MFIQGYNILHYFNIIGHCTRFLQVQFPGGSRPFLNWRPEGARSYPIITSTDPEPSGPTPVRYIKILSSRTDSQLVSHSISQSVTFYGVAQSALLEVIVLNCVSQ